MITNSARTKLGLVLGRFQPLHAGHLALAEQAFSENDEVVICIGSAEQAEPLAIEVRHQRWQKQLENQYGNRRWRIVDLFDPKPMEIWPEYVMAVCGITDGTENSFYRADLLPERYQKALEGLGFRVVRVARKGFYFLGPDGVYYRVNSATDIKAIYHRLGIVFTG